MPAEKPTNLRQNPNEEEEQRSHEGLFSLIARKTEYFTNFALNENTGYFGVSQTIK
jgi:hypothetical protein